MRTNSVAGARTAQRQKVLGLMQKAGKRSKYGNRKVTTDEGTFDSEKEYRRWCELRMLFKARKIARLQHHPTWALHVFNHATQVLRTVGEFTPDFEYWQNGQHVIEDVKGGKATVTEAYRLRKRMFEAEYNLQIVEI